MIQKKRTIHPEWNSCFDAHLYEGRVIQLIVKQRPDTFMSEVTVSAQSLADKCKDGELSSVWVSLCNYIETVSLEIQKQHRLLCNFSGSDIYHRHI